MGLIYEVVLPETVSPDVASRELQVYVNGVSSSYTVGPNDKTFVLPPMAEGVTVSVVLRDVDDAGNVSDWSEPYNFDTKDTIKPKMPGTVVVNLLEEVTDPAPVVEAPAVETPVDEVHVEPTSEDTVDLPPDHQVDFGV